MTIQEQIVSKLVGRGFKWQYFSKAFDYTVLQKYVGAGRTQCVEVDAEGLCNGMSIEDYLNQLQ